MNIFYVDPQSYNNLADYDKYLLENIKLAKEFYCSDYFPYDKVYDTNINKIYHYNKKTGLKKIISYCNSELFLFKQILKKSPDVIHFQWFKIPIFDYIVLKIIKTFRKSTLLVHTAHNLLPHDTGDRFKSIYKRIYNIVDEIIVHSEITKKEMIQQFNISEGKINVIPHGYLPLKYNFEKKNDGKFVFSFIGYLSNYKGLDLLLDAWCNKTRLLENKGVELLIAGAGNLDCIKSIPKNKNIILENYFHTEEELSRIVANTDVALLPYRKISQSGVLLTFLAKHIPVIVSKVGGLTQPFEIGNVGWIIEEITSENIASILESIIKDMEFAGKIHKDLEVWKKIDDFYDWKNIGNKTLNLYMGNKE